MKVRVFTLAFDAVLGRLDDSELQHFTKDNEILSVQDHFFMYHGTPYLSVVISYNLLPPPRLPAETPAHRENGETWRALLRQADWPLYNTLREWRNQQAREEGVPAYIICTNRQLAHIARERPATLTQLAAIEGIGRTKLERYGGLILNIMGHTGVQPQPQGGVAEPVLSAGASDGRHDTP